MANLRGNIRDSNAEQQPRIYFQCYLIKMNG